jgi:hypothetical protein
MSQKNIFFRKSLVFAALLVLSFPISLIFWGDYISFFDSSALVGAVVTLSVVTIITMLIIAPMLLLLSSSIDVRKPIMMEIILSLIVMSGLLAFFAYLYKEVVMVT